LGAGHEEAWTPLGSAVVKDFWDSLAALFGYDRWEWGSAADWVGAIGTIGAFLFGFLLFARDKQRQRRELADRFATWQEGGALPGTTSVFAHNGADLPVVNSTALIKLDTTTYRRKPLTQDTAAGRSVPAGASTSITLRDTEATPKKIWVEFTDGASRTWVRNLNTGRYLNWVQRFLLRNRTQ